MTTSVPFARFADAVLSLYAPPLRRIATYRKIRQVLAEFAAIAATTADLTPKAISDWIVSHPDRRRSTVRALLSALRSAVNLVGDEHGLVNPFGRRKLHAYLPTGTFHPPIRRHFGPLELARVLAQADKEAQDGSWTARRRRLVVYLAAYTGARAREILGLRVEDLDLVEGLIRIRPNAQRPLKTEASVRELPIAGPLASALEGWVSRGDRKSPWLIPHQYLTGPWLHGTTASRPLGQVKALGERAGVPGLTLLAFRHSFATSADRWQIGSRALQDLMGHASPSTQRTYRHSDPDELRSAVDRVRFG